MKTSSLSLSLLLLVFGGCSTLPSSKYKHYDFPRTEAFRGNTPRPYETLGKVRSKVEYTTLDEAREEKDLCSNYFNKAVQDLISMAKRKGGDAVIDIKSVVFLQDGRTETYPTPECSDDGLEGQILAQGIAIKWKPKELKTLE